MKHVCIYLALALLTFAACTTKSRERYTVNEHGLEYAYIEKADTILTPKAGDKLLLKVKIYNHKDSLLWDSREIPSKFIMDFAVPEVAGATIEDGYALMNQGDSVHFLINARSFYAAALSPQEFIESFAPDEKLKFCVRLQQILSPEHFEKEAQKIIEPLCEQEKLILAEFVASEYPKATKTESGLYFQHIEQGKGAALQDTNTVVIHYRAFYITGDILYNTYVKVDPLKFRLDDPFVWPCLKESVKLMKKGGKLVCIAPSELAASEYGDKALKIPPCRSLLFEIFLVAAM